MNVYLHGSEGQPPPARHTVAVCPAEHLANSGEMPVEWVDRTNKPVTFYVVFEFGRAEVDDKLGAYMVKEGIAQKTRLIIPNAFAA